MILFALVVNLLNFFRSDSSNGVNDRVLSQLLTELDGIQVKINALNHTHVFSTSTYYRRDCNKLL